MELKLLCQKYFINQRNNKIFQITNQIIINVHYLKKYKNNKNIKNKIYMLSIFCNYYT